MYTKHHTEGIVLASHNLGEADRYYYIFTRDLGLVHAKAKSIRELRSKMRFSLQDLSHSDMSLIRARDTWKVTNVVSNQNLYEALSRDREKLMAGTRILKLIKHMISGEEQNTALYDSVSRSLNFLASGNLSTEEIRNLEVLTVLRIMHHLGYLGGGGWFDYLLEASHVNDMHLYEAGRLRSRAVREINQAIRETQM